MNAKISVFVICVEAIIYLLLYNLHECTFKIKINLNFYFTLLYGASKGFIKAFKAISKPFEIPQKGVELKISVNFLSSSGIGEFVSVSL